MGGTLYRVDLNARPAYGSGVTKVKTGECGCGPSKVERVLSETSSIPVIRKS